MNKEAKHDEESWFFGGGGGDPWTFNPTWIPLLLSPQGDQRRSPEGGELRTSPHKLGPSLIWFL